MISVLHKIFLENVLDNISTKYKEQLKLIDGNLYTYSNIYNIPLYYNLSPFKKNPDYGLYKKLQENNKLETINFLVEKIIENNYNSNLILLLYSYITNITLNKALDTYTNEFIYSKKKLSEKGKMKIRSKIASSLQAHIYSIKYENNIKKFKIKNVSLEDETKEILNLIFARLHYFTFGKEVFEIGFKNFSKINKNKNSLLKGIHKFMAKITDTFTLSKKYSLYSAYHNYKVIDKYLCYSIPFTTVFDEAIQKAANIIELVSEEIYYKKKNEKPIEELLKK